MFLVVRPCYHVWPKKTIHTLWSVMCQFNHAIDNAVNFDVSIVFDAAVIARMYITVCVCVCLYHANIWFIISCNLWSTRWTVAFTHLCVFQNSAQLMRYIFLTISLISLSLSLSLSVSLSLSLSLSLSVCFLFVVFVLSPTPHATYHQRHIFQPMHARKPSLTLPSSFWHRWTRLVRKVEDFVVVYTQQWKGKLMNWHHRNDQQQAIKQIAQTYVLVSPVLSMNTNTHTHTHTHTHNNNTNSHVFREQGCVKKNSTDFIHNRALHGNGQAARLVSPFENKANVSYSPPGI